jgi:predicted NBD/HSP70 family sugar kinase
LLVEGAAPSARVGRPARPVSLNPDGPVALGIEINVDYIAACLLNLPGTERGSRRLELDNRNRRPSDILHRVLELCRSLRDELGSPLIGAALAVPGVVGADQLVLRAPNLPGLTGVELGNQLAEALGVAEVNVDNEANFGALGWLRSAPGAGPDFVYVSGEVGVGAGLVVGGRLFRGAGGFAGELGHVVVDRDGPPCGCGGRGCLEQYAGQDVLLRAAGQPDPAGLLSAVAAGEPAAARAVTQAGAALGVGLASLLNVFDLPVVVLGGLYAQLFDQLSGPVRAELDQRVLSGPGTVLRPSELGAEAAVRGAAGAVLDHVLADPAAIIWST